MCSDTVSFMTKVVLLLFLLMYVDYRGGECIAYCPSTLVLSFLDSHETKLAILLDIFLGNIRCGAKGQEKAVFPQLILSGVIIEFDKAYKPCHKSVALTVFLLLSSCPQEGHVVVFIIIRANSFFPKKKKKNLLIPKCYKQRP